MGVPPTEKIDRTGMNENLIKIEIQWPGLWHGLGFKRRERYLT